MIYPSIDKFDDADTKTLQSRARLGYTVYF